MGSGDRGDSKSVLVRRVGARPRYGFEEVCHHRALLRIQCFDRTLDPDGTRGEDERETILVSREFFAGSIVETLAPASVGS